ncbi:MAG TPA: hypothetical protein VN844_15105 [Pyrinomonadaceae bacterium]|nr:hypothetical protein [Pyrinomonadaceae bacterium]
MFDIAKKFLTFAADPPDNGGGTKKTPISGSDSTNKTEKPMPVDPPDNGGGTGG